MKVKVRLPKILLIPIIIIVMAVVGLIVWNGHKKVTISKPIYSEEQLYNIIANKVVNYQNEITYKTIIDPATFDLDILFNKVLEKDPYLGSQLYSYSYTYTITSDGYYKVKMKIKEPAPHRTLLTKLRVKQIASELKGLSDYDKVKAVHDYLILSNEYSWTLSGAFNTLYVGKSSCTGYAYSFYLIMKECGIPVTCEFGGAHAWNRVKLDGEWYNIDLTWDDTGKKTVGYDYFLKSDTEWNAPYVEPHHHGGATAAISMPITGKSAMQNYKMFPNYRLITIIIAVIIGAIIAFAIWGIYKKNKNKELYQRYGDANANDTKPQVKVIDTDDIEFDSPDLNRYEMINETSKTYKDPSEGMGQPLWTAPVDNPNMSFGQMSQKPAQAPQPSIYGQQPAQTPQPSIYGQQPAQAPQPSIYGQQPVQQTPQPSIYGQQPAQTPQPSIYGQQPAQAPQPSIYGQQPAQTPQPSIYGQQLVQPAPQPSLYGQQPAQTPQPLLYGQQQQTTQQPLLYGQPQQPFNANDKNAQQ